MLLKFKLKDGGGHRWLNLGHIIHISPSPPSTETHTTRRQEADGSERVLSNDETVSYMDVFMTGKSNKFTVHRSHSAMRCLRFWAFASRWTPTIALTLAILTLLTTWVMLGFQSVSAPPAPRAECLIVSKDAPVTTPRPPVGMKP